MGCNGKCHLMKQLTAADKKDTGATNNIKEKFDTPLFFENKMILQLFNPYVILKSICFNSIDKLSSYSLSVFHPPTC